MTMPFFTPCSRCGKNLVTERERPSGICALCYWDQVMENRGKRARDNRITDYRETG